MNFLSNFAQGAMNGAMAINQQRQALAEQRFKGLEKLREKRAELNIKADQDLADATAMAKFHDVDTSAVLALKKSGLEGDKLIEGIERLKRSDNTQAPSMATQMAGAMGKPDATPAAPAMGGSSAPVTDGSTVTAAVPQKVGTDPGSNANNGGVDAPAQTSSDSGSGGGFMKLLDAALFGGSVDERANDLYRQTYGKTAEGDGMARLQAAQQVPSKFKLGPKKVDTAKMVEGIDISKIPAQNRAAFAQALSSGDYGTALGYVQSEEDRIRLQKNLEFSNASRLAQMDRKVAPIVMVKFDDEGNRTFETIDDNDHTRFNELRAKGYNAIPAGAQMKGIDDLGPTQREHGELRQMGESVRNIIGTIGNVKNILAKNPDANTFAGNAATMLSNIAADATSLARVGKIDLGRFDPDKYKEQLGPLDNLGFDYTELKSNLSGLAYMVAASQGQSGRDLSDADVKRTFEQIGAGLRSPALMANILDNVQKNAEMRYANKYRELKGKMLDGDPFVDTKAALAKGVSRTANEIVKPAQEQPKPFPGRSAITEDNLNHTFIYDGQVVKVVKNEKGVLGIVPVKVDK